VAKKNESASKRTGAVLVYLSADERAQMIRACRLDGTPYAVFARQAVLRRAREVLLNNGTP